MPIPLLIIVGIYSGFSTATEAAALTVVYVLVVKVVVFRELSLLKDLPAIMVDSMKMVGGIMIILGAALGFTNYLVDAFIPMKILDFMQSMVENKIEFLIALNVFWLVVGCMMDRFSATLVVVPLVIPLASLFGIDPVHLGIIFLDNIFLDLTVFLNKAQYWQVLIEIDVIEPTLDPLPAERYWQELKGAIGEG